MFDSGISVKELVAELKNTEVDIALDIPNATYVSWLNSLQQLLYTEVIKEQRRYQRPVVTDGGVGGITPVSIPDELIPSFMVMEIYLSDIDIGIGEEKPRFEDIYAIYTNDGTQLIKTNLTSGFIFPNTFYKTNNNIGVRVPYSVGSFDIVYIVRPALIDVDEEDEIDNSNVMLPIEFIDLAKAKLRGEAYKLVNEDSIAAKWLNDYNVLLETFKAWIATKSSDFGI